MAKFVVHKKGFFYTDECFAAEEGALGSIVGSYANMDDAKAAKEHADIKSMQGLAGENAVDFFFDNKDFEAVFKKLESYYKSEFNLDIKDKYYFTFPKKISKVQAQQFLNIMNITFHDIVEYSDDEELNPDDFDLEEQELGEF